MNAAIYRDIPIGYAPGVAGIGTRLQRIRKPLMTQEELAERMGVEQPAVSAWENERTVPDAVQLAQIAAVLKRPAGDFLSDIPAYKEFLETATDSKEHGGQTPPVVTSPDKPSAITERLNSDSQSGEPRAETAVVVRRPSRSPLLIATELQQHVTKLRSHADSISELADSLVRRAPGTKPRPHPHRTPGGSGGASTVHRGTARGRGGK
jgi:transcriptional regulator with XRE-family HTH domain